VKNYKVSRISNNTKAKTVEVTFEILKGLMVSHDYSGSTFKNSHRNLENFEQTELIIIDVDKSLLLDEAKNRLEAFGYKYILATTKSHQKEKRSKTKVIPACDRFRIILFLDKPIFSTRDFKHTYLQLLTQFPELDSSCAEASRFFYPSVEIIASKDTGSLVIAREAPEQKKIELNNSSSKLGVLSNATQNFIDNGAEPGNWNNDRYC